MSVLDRAALEDSPLADLHAIASELSIDGYRRFRKPALIEAILDRQSDGPAPGGVDAAPDEPDAAPDEAGERPAEPAATPAEGAAGGDGPAEAGTADDERPGARRRRGRRGGRARSTAREEQTTVDTRDEERAEEETKPADTREASRVAAPRDEDEVVEGVVELVPNGSGFLRVNPPEPSDDDVYISAAQVKRCELLSGDRVAGPRRPPRRSERFASLVRIDTINGVVATELASGARFDDLPATFPDERLRLGSEDPTIKAIEWLTPFGKGSRLTITGAARSGKSHALRRLAAVLAEHTDIQVLVALAGVRPEEISEWHAGATAPGAAVSFAASQDAQEQAVELVVDQARRVAARGADAVVLIDTLELLRPQSARKAVAAARNIVGGGSLTVIATAEAPVGGETTVIALDAQLASAGRFPALDLGLSGTIRPELLVGDAGAAAIQTARREAVQS